MRGRLIGLLRRMSSGSGGASVTEGKATIFFPSEKGVFYNPPQIPNRDLSVLALRHFARQWQSEMEEKAAKQQLKAAKRAASEAAKASAASVDPDSGAPAPPSGPSCAASASAATPATETTEAAPTAPSPPAAGIRVLDALTASGLRALRYVLEVPQVQSVVANDLDPNAVAALRENVRRNGLSEDVIVPSTGDAVAVMHASKPPAAQRFVHLAGLIKRDTVIEGDLWVAAAH